MGHSTSWDENTQRDTERRTQHRERQRNIEEGNNNKIRLEADNEDR